MATQEEIRKRLEQSIANQRRLIAAAKATAPVETEAEALAELEEESES